jgi:hypothetical protein
MSYGTYPLFLRDCELVYDHLAHLRKTIPQDDLIERFQSLFIVGAEYPEPEILTALLKIVRSPWAAQEFDHILNRCCYILINYWWSHSGLKQGTVKLVQLLETLPITLAPTANPDLHDRALRFIKTEQFATIQDRARTVAQAAEAHHDPDQIVRKHIARYPFLYPHLLMHWDNSDEGHHAVRTVQVQREQQFEADLHRYCVAHWRSRHTAATPMPTPATPGVKNPTLLDNTQLDHTLKIYAGKVHHNHTYQELADHYRIQMMQAPSFQMAKQHLHRYLTITLDDQYCEHRFSQWLDHQLLSTLPRHNDQPPYRHLMIQTCCELVAALLANPVHNAENHLIFMDFNHNLGPTTTVGVLLQILLLCRGFVHQQWDVIKSYVSRFFASMFKHYETVASGQVEWLIDCLENLQIAFAIHSDRTDFSWMFSEGL